MPSLKSMYILDILIEKSTDRNNERIDKYKNSFLLESSRLENLLFQFSLCLSFCFDLLGRFKDFLLTLYLSHPKVFFASLFFFFCLVFCLRVIFADHLVTNSRVQNESIVLARGSFRDPVDHLQLVVGVCPHRLVERVLE